MEASSFIQLILSLSNKNMQTPEEKKLVVTGPTSSRKRQLKKGNHYAKKFKNTERKSMSGFFSKLESDEPCDSIDTFLSKLDDQKYVSKQIMLLLNHPDNVDRWIEYFDSDKLLEFESTLDYKQQVTLNALKTYTVELGMSIKWPLLFDSSLRMVTVCAICHTKLSSCSDAKKTKDIQRSCIKIDAMMLVKELGLDPIEVGHKIRSLFISKNKEYMMQATITSKSGKSHTIERIDFDKLRKLKPKNPRELLIPIVVQDIQDIYREHLEVREKIRKKQRMSLKEYISDQINSQRIAKIQHIANATREKAIQKISLNEDFLEESSSQEDVDSEFNSLSL